VTTKEIDTYETNPFYQITER